jgi:hypothetical protein
MSNSQQPNESGNTTQGQNEGQPSAIVPPPSPPSNSTAESKKGFCEKYKHEMELLGLLGLVFYCFINWRELKVFDRERETMEMEYTNSEASSQMQLAALQGQLVEMKNGRNLDERAWVGPIDFELQGLGDDFIVVTYKNTGKTPALNVFGVINFCAGTNQIPAFDKKPSFEENSIMAPNGTGILKTDDIPQMLVQGITQGNYVSFIYGTIWYDDVFGHHHWIQLCYSVSSYSRNMSQTVKFSGMPIHNLCDDSPTNEPGL